MKHLKVLMVALLLPLMTNAQGVAIKEGTIKMGKTKLKGYVATYTYTKQQVTDAMEQNLAAGKIKRSSRKKGFSIYKGVTWTTINPNKADYYYKAKKKKGNTELSFAASKGYDNYVTTATDAALSANISSYLQNLSTQIATNEKIKTKQGELKKMEDNGAMLSKQQAENTQQLKKKNNELQQLQPAYPNN